MLKFTPVLSLYLNKNVEEHFVILVLLKNMRSDSGWYFSPILKRSVCDTCYTVLYKLYLISLRGLDTKVG